MVKRPTDRSGVIDLQRDRIRGVSTHMMGAMRFDRAIWGRCPFPMAQLPLGPARSR